LSEKLESLLAMGELNQQERHPQPGATAGRRPSFSGVMASNTTEKAWIGLCESQPATAEGVRLHLGQTEDMDCRWAVAHLGLGLQAARQQPVDLLVIDKVFGYLAITDAIGELRTFAPTLPVLVWGSTISEPEAVRMIQAGASGLLKKTSPIPIIINCFRVVRAGGTWFGELMGSDELPLNGRACLTGREQQVLELVERGLKNKEIAAKLGIRPGTVKIHLKHIFEKKGVHGRYGLALNGIRQRGGAGWSTLPPYLSEAGD
jgi:DNA-binding NarL/FixJ family response regulator